MLLAWICALLPMANSWMATPCLAQPANDMFSNRITLTGTNVTTTGSNVDATLESGEPYIYDEIGGHSVWWTWTAPTSGTLAISTAGSDFDTLLGIYTGSSVSALTEVASNDDDIDVLTSKVSFEVTPGQTYQIDVDGYYGDSGAITLSLRLGPTPPPQPAPPWSLLDLYGQRIDSTNYAGKVVLLNFWATWCGPCVSEIPDLIALQEKYRADGLVIVGVSVDGDAQTVLTFESTTPLNYQVVMSSAAAEAAYGGIQYIPTTFIINRQNFITKSFVGSQYEATFEKQIVPLIYDHMRLSASRSGNQLVLRWPTNAVSFVLESAVSASSTWTTWPTLPSSVNGSNTVQVPVASSSQCYRLRLHY